MIARPRRPAREAKWAALRAARAIGCVCEPDVTVQWIGGLPIAAVAHDAWCPALRAREGAGAPPIDVVIVPRRST
jgi:hypothetical protein